MTAISLMEVSQLGAGASAEVVAEGRIFAVYNVDGTIYVMDGICPHAGGPLGKGVLRDGVVTCPWHGWQFNVATGQHCLNQRLCQATYPPRIENGRIVIDID